MEWLRISLEVEPELAEAVSEVLARYIPGGIAIESTAVEAEAGEQGHAVGPLRVMGYIPMDAQLEETRAQIEQGLRYLALIQPVPEPQYQTIQQQNWMEAWKEHYQPLPVGEKLLIVPAWMEQDPAGRIPIRIEPGMAFGTGVHPTTQLSLQLLERTIQVGDNVIDVGCGSAVLSIAAAKLGAKRIVGVDVDAEALDNARLNAELNGVEVEIGHGSVAEVLVGQYGLQQAEVVVANILAPVLVKLLGEGLAKLVAPSGTLLLSGILEEQEANILQAVEPTGLKITAKEQMGDWLAFALKT